MSEMPKSLAATMMSLQEAIDNCERSGNTEWLAKHRASLKALVKFLPSGSGIDNGTELIGINVNPEIIELHCTFHHMNENGYYTTWTHHKITVRPSFNGVDVRVRGPNKNDINDHLHEVYSLAMTERVIYDYGAERWVHERQGGE